MFEFAKNGFEKLPDESATVSKFVQTLQYVDLLTEKARLFGKYRKCNSASIFLARNFLQKIIIAIVIGIIFFYYVFFQLTYQIQFILQQLRTLVLLLLIAIVTLLRIDESDKILHFYIFGEQFIKQFQFVIRKHFVR